jgi:hypothetical protein
MKLTLLVFLTAQFFLFAPQMAKPPSKLSTLSAKEVKQLIAAAKSPEDHLRIAAYYEEEAKRLEEKKTEHTEMGAEYDKNPQLYPSKLSLGQHCRNLAGYYGLAEQKALELAKVHKQMAERLQN